MEQTMKQSQSGFTMLEVLVSILIMAIGMLGLAGLMAASMRNNHGAYHRTQAVWLAYDVADRMRANRQEALAGSYNIALGAAAPGGGAINAVDLGQWLNAVSALPQGQGAVNVADLAGDRIVTITVQWNDTRATGGDAAQQFQMQTRL
jgi:type IV pilus assembly protein PilV